jgi:hypothetical protein
MLNSCWNWKKVVEAWIKGQLTFFAPCALETVNFTLPFFQTTSLLRNFDTCILLRTCWWLDKVIHTVILWTCCNNFPNASLDNSLMCSPLRPLALVTRCARVFAIFRRRRSTRCIRIMLMSRHFLQYEIKRDLLHDWNRDKMGERT